MGRLRRAIPMTVSVPLPLIGVYASVERGGGDVGLRGWGKTASSVACMRDSSMEHAPCALHLPPRMPETCVLMMPCRHDR